MAELCVDLDWFDEGVAELRPDGQLVAANTVMRELLERLAPAAGAARAPGLGLLLPDAVLRRRLEAGDDVEVSVGDAVVGLRLRGDDARRLLIARAQGPGRGDDRSRQRVRDLARVAGSVVHELANQVNLIVGYADTLGDALAPSAAGDLATLCDEARTTLDLLATLARMLDWQPRGLVVVPLGELAAEVTALLRKHGVRDGREVRCERAAPAHEPLVRVRRGDALHLITGLLLVALETGDGALQVSVSRASGDRPLAVLQARDRAVGPPVYQQLAAALSGPPAELAARARAALAGAAEPVTGLLSALLVMRRAGGAVEFDAAPDGSRALRICWPEVSR